MTFYIYVATRLSLQLKKINFFKYRGANKLRRKILFVTKIAGIVYFREKYWSLSRNLSLFFKSCFFGQMWIKVGDTVVCRDA